jgi:hypothetical protein
MTAALLADYMAVAMGILYRGEHPVSCCSAAGEKN